MLIKRFPIPTHSRTEMINIDQMVRQAVEDSGIKNGICHVFVPHTTAGVTINENADPAVIRDILMELNKVIPLQDDYSHMEGNSAAHIKSSLVGCAQTIPVEDGQAVLGTWQSVFFCEFDGPRQRRIVVQVVGETS
ncbi:secondary thiamine-phosphate synthase enzyme YjbQ [Candidatus Zixiibacteriota bacterium]